MGQVQFAGTARDQPSVGARLRTNWACHEIGTIPDQYVEILLKLSQTHKLGVISDVWSSSEDYLLHFEEKGIKNIFDLLLFSSDLGIIKPSVKIFHKAIEYFNTELSKIVYIGDSFRRDVQVAKKAGIDAIWINDNLAEKLHQWQPDKTVADLADLLCV